VEFLTRLTPIDLLIVVALAAGVFVGFTQGMIRYALNVVVVVVAFVLAAQLRDPFFDLLSFWAAFSPELRRQIIFLVLFIGLLIGGWFIVRALYRRTRLPVAKQLDELGGAVLGLLWAALCITFLLVVMESYFRVASDAEVGSTGLLGGLFRALDNSVLVEFFRSTLIPTFGAVARLLVPSDIAELLERQ
jgi:uncharacterized membrane protein required for colicin V production